MHRRYGKFSLKNYIPIMLTVIVLDISCVFLFSDGNPIVLAACLLAFSAISVCSVYSPYRERFEILENSIIVAKGRKRQTISLPSKITVIISPADINNIFAKRDPVSLEFHCGTIQERTAVSILADTPLATVMEKLHSSHIRQYTNCIVEDLFGWCFLYSFVCNEALLDALLAERDCLAIVPMTLEPKFHEVLMAHPNTRLYIDRNCK